jgi:flagellar assembly protein FliH
MSSRAKRLSNPASVVSFPWDRGGRPPASEEPAAVPAPPPVETAQLALVERDAFERGLAQGEAVGHERTEAMLQQLTQTLQELMALRATMIRQTERQLVQLALAVARRIVHREITLNHDLLVAMARVALDRLGEGARVTIRLNPDDHHATGTARLAHLNGTNVTVVADPAVAPGGCRVESDLGTLDAGVDAQIQELGRALLGEEPEAMSNVA